MTEVNKFQPVNSINLYGTNMSQCKVTLLYNTPLFIAAHGARTCWESHDKSDSVSQPVRESDVFLYPPSMIETTVVCGPNDAALIERVGNKFKHASILEHLRICVAIDNQAIAQAFKENKYSDVTFVDNVYVISTNVRAMQAIDVPMNIKLLMLPEEYKYLFQ